MTSTDAATTVTCLANVTEIARSRRLETSRKSRLSHLGG